MSLTYEDLFAIRFSLLDIYDDESIIISKLKYELLSNGLDEVKIDQHLLDFYKLYGINFDLEKISSIEIYKPISHVNRSSNNVFNTNIFQFLMNSNNSFPNSLHNNISTENNNNTENNINDLNDSDDSDDGIDSDDSNETDDSMPELIDPDNDEIPINYMNLNINGNNLQIPLNSNYNLSNNNIQFLNQISSSVNNHPMEFLSVFGNFINNLNTNENTNENTGDVVVTLDESDQKKIVEYICKEDSLEKCSVCYSKFKKGDNISKLKCGHEFHKNCIMEWLQKYNYKCPVCRCECGEPKYHL